MYSQLATREPGDAPFSPLAAAAEAAEVDGSLSLQMEEVGGVGGGGGAADVTVCRNTLPVPISKPPTKHRDSSYAIIFVLHFALVAALSLLEEDTLHSSLIMYSRAGSWASMVMIITLLGSFIGICVTALVSFASFREPILSLGIPFSITLQICLGNILLLLRTRYSFLGALVLASAFVDSFSYKAAKDNMSFTFALMQMVKDVFRSYGASLITACVAIVVTQTFVLLWWGVFFVGLISNVSSNNAEYLIVIMALSLYWIAQFFQAFLAFIVGGCTLWYFVKSDGESLAPAARVMLHVQCGLTTSFGSLCKGALYSPLAHRVLTLHNWSRGRPSSIVSRCSARGFVSSLCSPFVYTARRHHRLAFCLSATYGRTLCKAAEEQLQLHPETIDISVEDATCFTLTSTATEIAGVMAIIFGVVAERKEGAAWPLFFCVCFCLAYCGLSLAVHVYRSAVDALIVAFSVQPERFARENQIVFLRLLRGTETALR